MMSAPAFPVTSLKRGVYTSEVVTEGIWLVAQDSPIYMTTAWGLIRMSFRRPVSSVRRALADSWGCARISLPNTHVAMDCRRTWPKRPHSYREPAMGAGFLAASLSRSYTKSAVRVYEKISPWPLLYFVRRAMAARWRVVTVSASCTRLMLTPKTSLRRPTFFDGHVTLTGWTGVSILAFCSMVT